MKYTKMTVVCATIFFIMLMYGAYPPSAGCGESITLAMSEANLTVNTSQNQNEARYTIAILPFQNNTNVPTAAISADDLFRSELIKTGYFKVVEKDKIYETIVEFVPNDNFYIGGYKFNDTFITRRPALGGDNTVRKKTAHRGEIGWLDIPIRIERHTIIKSVESLNTDFVIIGSINQFGEKIRVDIEIIGTKCTRILNSLTADAEGFERLPDIVNSLTLDVTKICRRVNAQRDTNNIVSRYKQGLYTYEVTIQKLEELSSTMPDSFAPPVTLLSIYLERHDMEEEIIAMGERILTLFDPQRNEHLEILQSMGIDPFNELAKAYEKKGDIDKAIETHSRAIKLYPVNSLAHYKGLALAYKRKGLEHLHIETLQKALLAWTTDSEIYYYLGAAMEKNGKFEQAVEYYRKCLKYTNDARLSHEIREKISQMESTK